MDNTKKSEIKPVGKKIKSEHQDVIDYQLDKLVLKLNPYFKSLDFTPNMITTLSLIFGIISLYLLKEGKSIYAGIAFFISYFFDCQDGNYARTYNMVSKYGNLYDKASDAIVVLGLLYVMFTNRYDHKFMCGTTVCGIIIGILAMKYYIKQDEYYDAIKTKTENEVDMSQMKYLRFFGTGSAATFVTIAIIISGFYKL
jgi:phosphatidylglycerophosphate synthase